MILEQLPHYIAQIIVEYYGSNISDIYTYNIVNMGFILNVYYIFMSVSSLTFHLLFFRPGISFLTDTSGPLSLTNSC